MTRLFTAKRMTNIDTLMVGTTSKKEVNKTPPFTLLFRFLEFLCVRWIASRFFLSLFLQRQRTEYQNNVLILHWFSPCDIFFLRWIMRLTFFFLTDIRYFSRVTQCYCHLMKWDFFPLSAKFREIHQYAKNFGSAIFEAIGVNRRISTTSHSRCSEIYRFLWKKKSVSSLRKLTYFTIQPHFATAGEATIPFSSRIFAIIQIRRVQSFEWEIQLIFEALKIKPLFSRFNSNYCLRL